MTKAGDLQAPMGPGDVIDYWFWELEPRLWFGGGEALDAEMRVRFRALVDAARGGDLDTWAASPRGRLALIILLDQLPRNIFRGAPQAYASDGKAQGLSTQGIEAGMDRRLALSERQFFYMPLVHAEDPGLQALSFAKFAELAREADEILGHAKAHAEVVERFGRFPARNDILGRVSSSEEDAFLASGQGRF
jgi:uncharacterized protein (DUF924 family)